MSGENITSCITYASSVRLGISCTSVENLRQFNENSTFASGRSVESIFIAEFVKLTHCLYYAQT